MPDLHALRQQLALSWGFSLRGLAVSESGIQQTAISPVACICASCCYDVHHHCY